MPRRRWTPPGEPTYPESALFVQRVMETLKVNNPRELARALGYEGMDDDRRFYRYAAGQSRPPFEIVMKMLKEVGWLTTKAQEEPTETPEDPVAQLQIDAHRIREELTTFLDHLSRLAVDTVYGGEPLEYGAEEDPEPEADPPREEAARSPRRAKR